MDHFINPKVLEYKEDDGTEPIQPWIRDFFQNGGVVAIPSHNPEDYRGWVVMLKASDDDLSPGNLRLNDMLPVN